MKTVMAGPAGVFSVGERVELSADDERDLVQGGYASYAPAPTAPQEKPAERGETAVVPPRETAAMPATRRGRGK